MPTSPAAPPAAGRRLSPADRRAAAAMLGRLLAAVDDGRLSAPGRSGAQLLAHMRRGVRELTAARR